MDHQTAGTIIPSSHRPSVLYWRLSDFRWNAQLGPKLRPHACKPFKYNHCIWGSENYSDSTLCVRPPFLNHILPKEMDFGVKQINYCFPLLLFFSKNYFWHQKSSNNCDILLIFEFYVNIFGKFIAGIPWFILKITKLTVDNCSIFPHVTFYFWKFDVWGPEKPTKQLIFWNKKSHFKDCTVFNILVMVVL